MIDYGLTQALYQFLTQDVDLMKTVKGVYTHIPADESSPHVHFYVTESIPSTLNREKPKSCLKMQLDLYSRYPGVAELYGIIGYLSRLLQGLNLNIVWNSKEGIACFKELSHHQVLLQNGITRKGSILYQVFMQF